MKNDYTMKISRLTVDKLGVKLYDRVSAVIAELVSNSYDADATEIKVEAPLGEYLATRDGKNIRSKDLTISVSDNGIGMNPKEVNDYFLVVGAERRTDTRHGRGDTSPKLRRKVMGRKGVGKLAPFGICEVIEVITSGGNLKLNFGKNGELEHGYSTAHIILNRKDILEDTDHDYKPKVGKYDNKLMPNTGTKIILKSFSRRRVPEAEVFFRQLAQRFGLSTPDWEMTVRDTTKTPSDPHYETKIKDLDIQKMPESEIRFIGQSGPNFSADKADKMDSKFHAERSDGSRLNSMQAGFVCNNRFYPLTGWAAYSQKPYKDDLMAGIRIYCRGKIAAQTTVFNRGAGFHGEHTIRSYLVGVLHADWLDEEEDLIQTDRRDILWSHDVGQKFQEWGQLLIKEIGVQARNPMRKKAWRQFMDTGDVEATIDKEFPQESQKEIRETAMELAKLIGQSMSSSDAEDKNAVEPMVQLTLTLAPHITLDKKLKEAADEKTTPTAVISEVLRTARIAELSSFGRIAEDRIRIIERLEVLKDDKENAEQLLQNLITQAPWLIDPQWAPITSNETFRTLKKEFEKFYNLKTGEDIILHDFEEAKRRPDFVLSSQDEGLQIIEIKKPQHKMKNDEMDRIISYKDHMDAFLFDLKHKKFRDSFSKFHITLICDDLALTGAQRTSYNSYISDGIMTHMDWSSFLLKTRQMHRDFLEEADKQKKNVR